jgi:hypothetical protein
MEIRGLLFHILLVEGRGEERIGDWRGVGFGVARGS